MKPNSNVGVLTFLTVLYMLGLVSELRAITRKKKQVLRCIFPIYLKIPKPTRHEKQNMSSYKLEKMPTIYVIKNAYHSCQRNALLKPNKPTIQGFKAEIYGKIPTNYL